MTSLCSQIVRQYDSVLLPCLRPLLGRASPLAQNLDAPTREAPCLARLKLQVISSFLATGNSLRKSAAVRNRYWIICPRISSKWKSVTCLSDSAQCYPSVNPGRPPSHWSVTVVACSAGESGDRPGAAVVRKSVDGRGTEPHDGRLVSQRHDVRAPGQSAASHPVAAGQVQDRPFRARLRWPDGTATGRDTRHHARPSRVTGALFG